MTRGWGQIRSSLAPQVGPSQGVTLKRLPTQPIHVVTAVRQLMTRYYQRLAARIPEDD